MLPRIYIYIIRYSLLTLSVREDARQFLSPKIPVDCNARLDKDKDKDEMLAMLYLKTENGNQNVS